MGVIRILAVVAAVVAALGACSRDHGVPGVKTMKPDNFPALRGGKNDRAPPHIANYKIDARFDSSRHSITATETLTWTNSGTSQVTALPFHLYLNAFKNDASLFMKSSHGEMRGAKAADGGWGWISIESVQIGGVELLSKWKTTPPVDPHLPLERQAPGDETVAELTLPQPIPGGGSVEITFKFTAQLPEVFARTGYKGDFNLVGQWFPKIGVRSGPPGLEHWDCQWFHVHTEFFADFGVYDVTLTVPNTYRVAATGVLVATNESAGNTRTLTYHAEDVHDFVWMADPMMNVITGQAKLEDGSVEVRVYYRAEQKDFAQRHLEAGIGAIERFSAAYVPYPWPIMSIIDPPPEANGAGGMEYPTLVTTVGDSVFSRPGFRLPEYVTVHEVGHNWFQGMLASNEFEEAWLDEGVNEWADAKAMDEIYGATGSAIDWMGWQAQVFSLRRALATDPGSMPSPIATAAYAFVDGPNYGEATYLTTMRALRTLEQTVGPANFAAAMKTYAKTWAFKHPTGRDLFATLAKELKLDLTWFFAPVFEQAGGLKLSIRSSGCRATHPDRGVFGEGSGRKIVSEAEAKDKEKEIGGFTCEVVVQSMGPVHVPVDLEFRFADGSMQSATWLDHGGETWRRFTLQASSRLVDVRLDPQDKIGLDSPFTHHERLEGDGAASLRTAAWLASVTQTLMEVIGP